jgi:hypothetical protein
VSRGSVVGIATGFGLDDREVGVRVQVGSRIFSTSSIPLLGSTQPPIQWTQGVKRPWREADHSPPASAEVKKVWICTSTPPYAFMTGTTLPLPYVAVADSQYPANYVKSTTIYFGFFFCTSAWFSVRYELIKSLS